jgi:2,3-bisphosphoglycerate-dependent phosphoglycerate mutase
MQVTNTSPRPFQLGLPQIPSSGSPGSLTPDKFPVLLPHPVELHMMRHGESAANSGKLITGFMNVPLTKLGRRQARQAGRKLSGHYDIAFSSTLFRSRETLQLALKTGKLDDVCTRESPSLAERQLGELELQSARPIPEYAGGDLLYAPKGGESYFSVAERSLHFLVDLAQWIQSRLQEGGGKTRRILICTHMGPMRIISGILNEESDPVRILARSFSPTQLSVFHWTRIVYPKFLAGSEQVVAPANILDQVHDSDQTGSG